MPVLDYFLIFNIFLCIYLKKLVFETEFVSDGVSPRDTP